jgi:methylenetetrahydrofolate dehydrogenase (NADP+) / methenyltetrahydrofolate cyclohydrolase
MLDGRAVAAGIRESVLPDVRALTARAGRPPGLAIVLVGNDPSSEVYVRNKVRTGTESGLWVDLQRLAATATLDDLLALVAQLNASAVHDGILVQSPLPAEMGRGAAQRVFDAIDPAKDVDGFHPTNVGRLVQGRARLMPCTPSGIIELLVRSGIPISGAHAVVIGRSEIVGKPMAMLLLAQHATVTICHSRTVDLASHTRRADVLVAAVGREGLVTPDMVKPGATVVDVAMNRSAEGKLVGDVDPGVFEVAGLMTPVPGGVGPMTIAMLLRNTLTAAQHRRSQVAVGGS